MSAACPVAEATTGANANSMSNKTLLIRILLHFVVEELELDAGLVEKFLALGTAVVFALADHTFDAAIDDEHGAGAAGCHAAVERGAVEGDTTAGGLADGVLLSMHGTHAVCRNMAVGIDGLAEEVSHLVAVRQAAGRTHVAGDQQLLVLHDDTTRDARRHWPAP